MQYKDQTFENMDIILDNNEYIGCIFKSCNLHYAGGNSISLENCALEHCRFTLDGCAANTIGTLSAFYKMGFRKQIDFIIDDIRGNVKPKRKGGLH